VITIVLHPRDGGIVYDASLDGETIVTNVTNPEAAAAWVMHERGLSGPFQTTDATGRIRMTFPSIADAPRKAPRTPKGGSK
jgi:hypothetical protein